VVGDVSGHGISSALLMTTARAFLRQRAAMPGAIREIVSDVNRRLSEDTRESGQFMTLFYGAIDLRQKIFRWVRAGHDAAFFYDGPSDSFTQLDGGGLPLGVISDVVYEQHQRAIMPGQIIVIGTDGIWETRNPQNEMFGKARLRKIIQDQAQKSAREIITAVFDALNAFRYPLEIKSDDITLVIVKVETPIP
jgi:sigma-B regulation protein RsbU (phosphoserine phosphatase)